MSLSHESEVAPRRQADQPRLQAPPAARSQDTVALHLQRTAGNAAMARAVQREEDSAGDAVRSVIAAGGRPLDAGTRREAEAHLGADLEHVRVHDDAAAARSAAAVQAQAYTTGSHVVFGEGKLDTSSTEGRHRMMHELTHVVQQQAGPVDGAVTPDGLQISDPGDRFERAADESAAAFVQREAAGDEEEPLQMQREADEEEPLQMQREADEEEPLQMQRAEADEDELQG